jgi:2-polyprenyl-3-methyl-5-hydroxy-6-metoxy-1,4-benzoquinol methylase
MSDSRQTSGRRPRDSRIDDIQSAQYDFPYHYLPSPSGFPNFSKHLSFAPSYLAALRLFRNWLAEQAESTGHKHMDFGCGAGGFINAAIGSSDMDGIEFSGIDYDEKAIQWAKAFQTRAHFTAGNIADLPAGRFDSGSLIEVYEHIPPDECIAFLQAIARALAPGAGLFVTVPSTAKPLAKKHYRHFDQATLTQEFARIFDIEEIFGFEKTRFITRLILRLCRTRWWYIETKPTNHFLVASQAKKHKTLNGCGRIGMVVRKKSN